jgi:hypothetical protein
MVNNFVLNTFYSAKLALTEAVNAGEGAIELAPAVVL